MWPEAAADLVRGAKSSMAHRLWAEFLTLVLVFRAADAARQLHPPTCKHHWMQQQKLQQQQLGSSSLLQLGMDATQTHFDPIARERDPELLTVQAWPESAGSSTLQQPKPTRITKAGSMSQLSANTTERSLSLSMAPNGSRNGSGAHGTNKELQSWDSDRSIHVKAKAFWRHMNSVLLSAKGFRVHLGSSSRGLLLDISCVLLSLSGITLFIFCVLVQYNHDRPNRQLGVIEKQVKKGAAGTCRTGLHLTPAGSLECSHDFLTAWERRSVVSSSRVPFAVGISTPRPVSTGLPAVPPDLGRLSSLAALRSPPMELCAGLVVPEGCECTLLVPKLIPTCSNCKATINDLANIPVFSVVFCRPEFPAGVPTSSDCEGDRCLALCSISEDGTLLAYCRSSFNNTLGIFNADDDPFGMVRMRTGPAGSFEVITQAGSDLHLSENRFGDVFMFDSHGQTLALTEPHPSEPEFRLFRVGPNCDAGLATLCVLVVDLLKTTAEAGRGFPGKERQRA